MMGPGTEQWMPFERAPGFDFRRGVGDGDMLCATRWHRRHFERAVQTRDPFVIECRGDHDKAVAVERITQCGEILRLEPGR